MEKKQGYFDKMWKKLCAQKSVLKSDQEIEKGWGYGREKTFFFIFATTLIVML